MELLPGVTARTVPTDRLDVHVYEAGPEDGVPVVLVQGNLSTGRFYEELMSGAPGRYRLLAPDMRGFGRTQRCRSTRRGGSATGPTTSTRSCALWASRGLCTSPAGRPGARPSRRTPRTGRSPA